jgi:signal transduction histidine kinase
MARLFQLDLRGKITLALLSAALVLGGVVFLIVTLVTRHLVLEHGQDLHLLEFLFPVFAVMGVVVIFALTLFARFSARLISAPLLEIAAAAEEIATSGRPGTHLPIRRDDEFGRLSAAFNTMVDRLAESYAELEQRIAERTRDYEESQHEAQKASSLLRESVQSIAQGFTIYDENDCLVLCNEAYLSFYETSRDLIVPGNTFEEIVRKGAERGQYKEAIGNVDTWVRARVAQHQNANGEVIEQNLGDGRWLMIVEYRTPSGYIVGNRIDITELKRATEKIREHSGQLDAIFALSPDGFVSFDSDYRVKYASPAFQHMTGVAEADVVGLDEAAFSALLAHACIPAAVFPGMATLRASQKVGASGTATDEGMGRRLVIEMAGPGKQVLEVGIRQSHAATVSQILYFRDITHETEVDRLKSEFLSTAAHELRTPMASIYGFTELLLNQDFDAADQRDFLATIFKQSELMVSIINELLDLARIEARRGKDFVIEDIDVRALLREIVTGFKTPLERPAPLLPPPNGPHWVRADRKKLTQAVSNVLSNAYKYSPDGGTVSIEFRLAAGASGEPDEQTPSLIGIRISDHGIGMAPEQLARVCERFYRADTSGKIPGTGLGMSIVKEIVELHGGVLDLDSQVGTGTRVTLWLPALGAAAST